MSALRSNTSGPVTPVDDKRFEIETVHVKDTDFQLIKPIPPVANSNSDDSLANSARDSKNDSRFLRTDSPSVSMLSGGTSVGTSSPLAEQFDAHPASPVVESPTAAEAHRQRELRWISLMTSTPAGQARKSKKVRKLLLEGVPASVRHLVWANLANSAGKRMDGLYAKLSQRGRVPASNDIERDVRRYFNNQPLLQDTNSPVTTLLQAYLTMVPDIRYNTGLCLITGHLLQQAPEEEAFWIFVSIMDTHLRSYFSPLNVQAEVDGSLLLKAIEANEPAIAKKLSDTGITAGTACRHWFCSLFVTTLPTSHVSRVWDIFLCEGMPFLFRVALAILSSCRRLLLDARSPERLTELLFQPPPDMLPPTPDALISLAHSMKLKDDDLMKTRQKLETQLKRQNQGRALRSTITTNGSAPPSISLPRA
ncbi:TBC-domain-containing protein [Punctularia strigosozonata HHB-11173 SS5]|uniref:TBC-domain-containing protein n=1 Tax=Punctularia strigosozonata (strain HHB-11173) TaxID=741275 RepID=UPI0004418019|nr:TBC-domain-containing protein [Punctularia strigosozonata HHB-11173 SS5]EIN12700.1 TBC-domain-containing protein [Punctularia strigosozonata HHB-11173 SS5]